jgi:hypothetical protein
MRRRWVAVAATALGLVLAAQAGAETPPPSADTSAASATQPPEGPSLSLQAADSPASTASAPSGPPTQQAASDKVKEVSREDLDALNAKLREAMALYYDRSYRLALPLLQEIAAKIDTMDVLYWTGHAAYLTGQPDLAISKFQTMLERDPQNLNVRLELAQAYLLKGDKLAAKAEIDKVNQAKIAPALRQQLAQSAAQLAADDKRLYLSARASVGLAYDTNINVSASDATINLRDRLGRDAGTLTTRQLDGMGINFNVNGDVLYDFGGRNGWVSRGSLYFLHNEYPEGDDGLFNYTQTDVRSGLEYYAQDYRGRLPFGFIDRRFSNSGLSRSFYFAPSAEYSLNKNLELLLSYRYEDEEFIASRNDAQGNFTHTVGFGPRYRFEKWNALHVVTLNTAFSERSAEAGRFSYGDWSIGPSYFARFSTGTEVYADLRFLDREYGAPEANDPFIDAIPIPNWVDRRDKRYSASVAVSQNITKYFFVSASFAYVRNDSNVPLFDYEKMVGGVNLGVNLNL